MCDVTLTLIYSLALPKEAIGNHAVLKGFYGYSYCLHSYVDPKIIVC